MSEFLRLTDTVTASPQLDESDIAEAARLGFAMIINNRPEGESADQVAGARVAALAQDAGLAYRAIPVSHAGFRQAQVDAMRQALDEADGPVLAYCRSGTRSTLLWALAQASAGADPEEIAGIAAAAGYDVAPIRPAMDMLAAQSR